MLTTTLSEIRRYRPCENGFAKICDHFGVSSADAKTHTDPFPIPLLLETNSLNDALWVFGRVAPINAIRDFMIRRLDTGEHSALASLRSLRGDWSRQESAISEIVALLHRAMAGEDVATELRTAADAAYAAAAATADGNAAYAAYAAGDAAVTAAAAAAVAAAVAAAAVTDAAAAAAYAAARDDLIAVCAEYKTVN